MTNQIYKITLSEVSTILRYLDKSLVDRIPQRIRDNIELNKSNDYIYNYDPQKGIAKQKMLRTTELYLAKLYLDYISTESETQEVIKSMKENEKVHQKKIRELYNPDDLFNSKLKDIKKDNEIINKNVIMSKYKKSFLIKMINRIKSFLGK